MTSYYVSFCSAFIIYKKKNSTQNKSQTHRAKQYEVMSILSTDCELSTDTCSKNVYNLGPIGTLTDKAQRDGLPKPLMERYRSRTMCLTRSTRSSIWEADSNAMGTTKTTCVIAWTLHNGHSCHCPTYG